MHYIIKHIDVIYTLFVSFLIRYRLTRFRRQQSETARVGVRVASTVPENDADRFYRNAIVEIKLRTADMKLELADMKSDMADIKRDIAEMLALIQGIFGSVRAVPALSPTSSPAL